MNWEIFELRSINLQQEAKAAVVDSSTKINHSLQNIVRFIDDLQSLFDCFLNVFFIHGLVGYWDFDLHFTDWGISHFTHYLKITNFENITIIQHKNMAANPSHLPDKKLWKCLHTSTE